MDFERLGTVVIGGGQAGLAVGYNLARQGRDFVILDAGGRVGDAWRTRWDSLRLFTPARYSGLPGLALPGPRGAYPTKDQLADYLEAYAARMELPVRLGTTVECLERHGDRFRLTIADATGGTHLEADQVVVATGLVQAVPSFAGQLDPAVRQFQALAPAPPRSPAGEPLPAAARYRNPCQLPDGPVLVVGAGNSGAEIAMDLAPTRTVWLSGRDTGRMPLQALRWRPFWWAYHAVNTDTRLGRKLAGGGPRGTPLVRVRPKDLAAAGVERVPPTVGVRGGRPVLAGGRVVEPAAVVWCNGFAPGFRWIDLPVVDRRGFPRHRRGLVDGVPGLGFVGLPFQYAISSGLLNGMVRDAAYVVDQLSRGHGHGRSG
jgi:putative flavoprotein involved in K+ transport